MTAAWKIIATDLCGVTLIYFLVTYHFEPSSTAHIMDSGDKSGAVAGRFVSIPAKDYINSFKASIKLGECPLVMQDRKIKICKDEFEGEVVYLPKGATVVDVSRVQSSEDILLHIMGGVGFSVGVLGLVDVNVKAKVSRTTDTSKKALNLISSYAINNGVITLHNPRPKVLVGDKPLFLSEIELGGNEMFLVTLEFESEDKKVAVEASVTLKILFISITAKVEHIEKTFKSKASCKIQFKSSWREDREEYFTNLTQCIPRVKYIEDMYMQGPQEIRDMSPENETSHLFYHFSSWKESPYGAQFNLALINHDLEALAEQNTEIQTVIQRINKLIKGQTLKTEVIEQMVQLNTTLTDMSQRIATGLKQYHNLIPEEREQLRDIYGQNKAPMFYERNLEKILSSSSGS